jgi:hypothetical protein
MICLRGASGLGDAVYMYPVLKHLIERGEKVEMLTKFPVIYDPLRKLGLIISERYAKLPDRECRYSPRYEVKGTTTYQDTLILAGVDRNVPLEIDFEPAELPDSIKSVIENEERHVCLVRAPALPMKGREEARILVPDIGIMDAIIAANKKRFLFVQVGDRNGYEKKLKRIDLDLAGALTIPQLLTLTAAADVVLTQPSFMLPFAESVETKAFVVFSGMGMVVPRKFFHHITPGKIINKPWIVWHGIDTEPYKEVAGRFGELLQGHSIRFKPTLNPLKAVARA